MTQLPNPKKNETIYDYLERLDYYWTDLWTISDVLFLHENCDDTQSDSENHRRTGISEKQAIATLKYAQECNDASGEGLTGFPLLGYCLDYIQNGS